MKIKIFTTDSNGKISLTKNELEGLLKESYEEGFNTGRDSVKTIGGPVRREFVYSSEPQLSRDASTVTKATPESPKVRPNTSPIPTASDDELIKLLNGIFGGGSIGNSPTAFSVNTKSNPSTIFDKLKKEVEGV